MPFTYTKPKKKCIITITSKQKNNCYKIMLVVEVALSLALPAFPLCEAVTTLFMVKRDFKEDSIEMALQMYLETVMTSSMQ